jgi:hypothetical protein
LFRDYGFGEEVVVVVVVSFFSVVAGAGDSLTIVVFVSVLFCPGGFTVVVSDFSQAARSAAPANMQIYFFILENYRNRSVAQGVGVGVVASAGLAVVVVSEVAGLGLASGATTVVSFFSQAASNAAVARMQIYFFIIFV